MPAPASRRRYKITRYGFAVFVILKDGIFYSQLFSDYPITHGFTTRQWGNLGFGNNPGDPAVVTNRQTLRQALNLTDRILIQPSQQHTDRVIRADEFEPGIVADASISASAAHLLSVLTADCVPVLVYDPDGFVAAIHCGWRGLENRIIAKTLKQFSSRSVAAIGPSIGGCCYEVGEDLAQRFAGEFGEQVVLMKSGGNPHLDLVGTAILQLQQTGVEEIDAAHLCTRCHTDLFFSFRRDGSSGRMMSFIGLRNS